MKKILAVLVASVFTSGVAFGAAHMKGDEKKDTKKAEAKKGDKKKGEMKDEKKK